MGAGTAARAVLVIGARGVLGGALVSAFEDAGWRVVRGARERGRRSRIRDNQQPVRRVFGGQAGRAKRGYAGPGCVTRAGAGPAAWLRTKTKIAAMKRANPTGP